MENYQNVQVKPITDKRPVSIKKKCKASYNSIIKRHKQSNKSEQKTCICHKDV